MPESQLPEDLERRIVADLQPVRPLRPAWRRTLAVALPWSLCGLAVVAGLCGLRQDIESIGGGLSWITSATFAAAAFALAVAAVREGRPASRVPSGALVVAICGVAAAQLATASVFHTHQAYPVPPDQALRLAVTCTSAIAALALPWAFGVLLLFLRGYPTRLALPIGLAVFSAVVVAEALWRLHCPFTSPAHLLAGHFPAYGLVGLPAVPVVLWLHWRIGGGRSHRHGATTQVPRE